MRAADLLTAPTPVAIVVLKPSAWVVGSGFQPPTADVAVGLRLLSQAEVMTAKSEAEKEATARARSGEEIVDRYNAALLAWGLGYAVCDPNNAAQPYFKFGDESVRQQLTPDAARHLWDELERAQVAASPLRPAASDDDLAELALLLTDPDAWERLPSGDAARLRRWLHFCLDELSRG